MNPAAPAPDDATTALPAESARAAAASAAVAAPSSPDAIASRGYAYYVLFMLALVNMLNYVDRNILAVLLKPIKQEFGVSDEQLGLLTGLAFIVVHSIFGLPLARIADRTTRRSVVAWGVAVWSAMTAAMGLATQFAHLLVLRMGVGIGEAASAPPSHSLLSDYFPPERRATALSLLGMGIYAGTMFGYLAAGWVGEHFGWRMTFAVVGLPGLVLGLLVGATVREPARAAPVSDESVLFVLRYLASKRSFVCLMLAASCHATAAYAAMMWTAMFYMRVHGLTLAEVGLWLGLVLGIGGAIGAVSGGVLVDRLGRRDLRWYAWVASAVALLAVPAGLLTYLVAPDATSSLAACALFIMMIGAYNGPLHAMNQFLAKPRMRSTSVAIQLFIVSLIGGVTGPWVVGRASDLLRAEHGELGIRYALAATVAIGATAASLFYFLTSLRLREDVADASRP